MKKKRILIFIVIFVVIAVAVVMANSMQKRKLPDIKTVSVAKGDIQSVLSTNALIQSKKTKSYIGSLQYKVEKVNFEVGEKVKKGDTLLTYDIKDLKTAVEQARIQLNNAILNKNELLKKKKEIEEDIIELDEQIFALDGSSNPEDLALLQSLIQKRNAMQEISDEQLMLMDNSIALAELSLNSALERLNEVKDGLVSEFDGVVTAVNATEGTTLNMSQPAFVVQQLDNLKGVIHLGKYDAAKIRIGQKASLTYGDKTYEGVVSFIEPAASKEMSLTTQEASLKAEIDIKNPDDKLKVDFDVDADIVVAEAKQVLVIPIECIRFERNNASVFVVKDGIAKLTPVKLGIQSDTYAEVAEGLSEGDVIISNPSMQIEDGTVVAEGGDK